MNFNYLEKWLHLFGLLVITVRAFTTVLIRKQDTLPRMPKFIKEPPGVVYYSSADWKGGGQHVINAELEATVYPFNSTLSVAAAYKDSPEHHIQLPILRLTADRDPPGLRDSPSQPYASLTPITLSASFAPQNPSTLLRLGLFPSTPTSEHQSWLIKVYNLFPNMILYLLLSTELGTIRTRPIRLLPIELPRFPRYADERLSVLIGNTGRVICHLPRSQPSLPAVNFYHNGKLIDMLTEASRYRLVYVGGDGSGTPWSSGRSRGPRRDPLFWQQMPSAVILFIHPLELSDSGEYKCEAQLMEHLIMAEQKTILNVTKPMAKVKARLQFSADDPGLSYLYDMYMSSQMVSGVRTLNVPVGLNLTLFCLFEGAPIVPTRWYYDGAHKNFREDSNFGILTIDSVELNDAGTYTCLAQSPESDAISKSFKIKVTTPTHLVPQPRSTVKVRKGSNILLACLLSDKASTENGEAQSADLENRNTWQNSLDPQNRNRTDGNLIRGFQPGTDIGWLYNGKSIRKYRDEDMPLIEATEHATIFRVQNFSEHDQGVYQCWSLDNMGTWLTASISARLEEVEQEGWNPTTPSRHDVIQERTKEGLTGHLNCNISFMQIGRTDQFEGQEEMLVFWFRGRQIGEPIDLAESNNRAGRIKYLTSRVNRMSQLLSIVNPRRSEDSGAYSCRVYDPKTRALLGQIQFELIIDPNEEEGIETRRLSAPSVSSITVENVKAKISHSNSVETDPWVDRAEDMAYRPVTEENFLQQFSISKPTVVRISNFSTGVWISWRVNDDTANHRISKFFLQYRVLMPAAQDYGVTKTRHRFIRQSKAHDEWAAKFWSQPKDTNVSTNQSFFCLHAPMYFQPGNIYSVRIIANEDQFVQPTIQPKIYQSSWSDAISLENLLPTKPRVISLTAQNSSTLELEWTMDSQFSQSIPNTDDAHQLGLYFLLIYRTLQDAHSGSLWASCTVNGTHRDLHVTSVQWLAQPVVSDVPGEQKNYRYSIQNLRQNTTYAVAVYGVIVQNNTLSNKIPPKFTLLSETVIQKTSADFTETRVEPKKASGILEDTKVRRDEKTVEDVVSRHTAGDSEITQKSVAKHKLVNLKENHIIIVVLGSLAGVLLVVAVMLIILCLWCQIRTKRNAYSDIFKSPNKGRATVSSTEVPCAPIERGLNGHPGLSYTDAYLTDYLLAQPTTLDPNVQLLGNFTAMLKDPHSTLSWPSLAFTSDVLHHNSVGPWSNSLRQSAANPILNRYFPGGGPQPSLASNGAINGLFFATEQTSYKHTTDEDGDSAPVDSVNEESGRDRGGLGKGDQFGSIPFFPDSVEEEANAGQNDQSSSVYSHIGSISTLNELPPRIYDKNGPRNNGLNAISSPVYIPGHESQLMRPIPMYLRPQTSFPGPTTDRTGFFSAFGSGFIQPDLKPSVPLQPSLFYRTLPPRNILDPTKQLEMIQRLQSPESNPFAPIQPDHQTYGIRPSIPPIPFNNVLTSYPCRPALENHLSEPKTVLNGRGTDTYPDTASMSHLGTQQFPEKSVSGPTKNFGLPAQCEQEYPTDVDGAVQERTESHSTNKKLGSSYTDSGVDLQVSGNGNDSNGRGDVQSKLETQNLSSPDYTSPKTVDSVLQDEIRIRRPIRKHDNSGRYKSNYSSQSDGSFEGESQNCSSNKVPMMGRSCNGATDNLPKNLGRFRQTNKRPYAEDDGDDALKNLMPDFIV